MFVLKNSAIWFHTKSLYNNQIDYIVHEISLTGCFSDLLRQPECFDICMFRGIAFNCVAFLFQNGYFDICNGMAQEVKKLCYYFDLVLSSDVKFVPINSFVCNVSY